VLKRTEAFIKRLQKWGLSAEQFKDGTGIGISVKFARFGLVDELLVDRARMTAESMADYYARQFLYSIRQKVQEQIDYFESERWNGTTSTNPSTQDPASAPTPGRQA
jgi:hypothetical protein